MAVSRSAQGWLALQLGLGLVWCGLLALQAPAEGELGPTGPQVFQMLVVAGWLPSIALACWQRQHRRWRWLIISDLLGAAALLVLAFTLYLPLFFFNVAWFLPLALMPRGLLAEILMRGLARLTDPGP